MSSTEDFEKLKVADLRKELKARGLSMTGNKPELVQRLLDSKGNKSVLSTTEDDDALGDDVLGISAADSTISGFPLDSAALEDKILDDIPPTPTEVKMLSAVSPAKVQPTPAVVTSAPSVPAKSGVLSPTSSSTEKTSNDSALSSSEGVDEGKKKKITFGTADAPLLSPAERAKKFNLTTAELSPEQRKNVRQERFGGGDVLNKRAERFHLAKQTAAETKPSPTLDAAQQKRLERFGGAAATANGQNQKESNSQTTLKLVTPSAEALKKRAERFGIEKEDNSVKIESIKNVNEEDRKNKRQLKFDLNPAAVAKEADPQVKRQKRAERFTIRQ